MKNYAFVLFTLVVLLANLANNAHAEESQQSLFQSETSAQLYALHDDVAPPVPEEDCQKWYAETADTIRALRTLVGRCGAYDETFKLAQEKNSAFPLASPPISLRIPDGTSAKEVMRIETHVYFNYCDAYLDENILLKLNQLIGIINNSIRIESIQLYGGVDSNERKLNIHNDLSLARANAVERYFRSAGLNQPEVFSISVREPSHENTLAGRMRDRYVEITLIAIRERLKGNPP